MADTTSPLPAPNRSRRGWRYSLRALLIVLTLACVGVWYWYRVPYSDVVAYAPGQRILFQENQQNYAAAKEVRHFRRVLRGEPIREGLTEFFDADGNRLGREHWREGQLHGEFLRWYPGGQVQERGEYRLGRKAGTWEQFDLPGRLAVRLKFDRNLLDGDAQWFKNDKVSRTIRYDHGEVTAVDGRPVNDPLGRANRLGQIAEAQLSEALLKPARVDFQETPLKDVADFIAETYRENVVLDFRSVSDNRVDPDHSVTFQDSRINLDTMLVLLCEPRDLAATYRFGTICITTKDDAANWVDRTGVSELLTSSPPGASPRAIEKTRSALDKTAHFDFLDTPLSDVTQYLSETYRIDLSLDTNSLKNAGITQHLPVTNNLRGTSLRNALGNLLDQLHLRVRWKDDGTLAIEPERKPGS